MEENIATAAAGKNGEERTPEKRQPDNVKRDALAQSQRSAMETDAQVLRPLAKRLFPFRQVE